MFQGPNSPYYASYKDHVFRISHYHPVDELSNHVWLICDDDPSVEVKGYVHLTDLEEVEERA